MDAPEWLGDTSLTYKDRLVRLAAEHLGTTDVDTLSQALGASKHSIVKSLNATPGAKPPTRKDEIIEALIDACGMDRSSMRSKDHTHVATVAAGLNDAGVDPREIHLRASLLRRRFRMAPTPGAIDKYWAHLAPRERFSPAQVLG